MDLSRSWLLLTVLQLPGIVVGDVENTAILRFRLWLGNAPESWKSAEAWKPEAPAAETVRTTVAQFFLVDYAHVEIGLGRDTLGRAAYGGGLRLLQGLTQNELREGNAQTGVVVEGSFHCNWDQLYAALALADDAFRDSTEFQTILRAYGLYWGIHPDDLTKLQVNIGALELISPSQKAPPDVAWKDERYRWYAAEWGPCDATCHGVQIRQRWCEEKKHSGGSGSIEARVDTRLCLHLPKPVSWQECQLQAKCPAKPGGGAEQGEVSTNSRPPSGVGSPPGGLPSGPPNGGSSGTGTNIRDESGNLIFVPWEFFLIAPVDRWLEAEGFEWTNIVFACVGPMQHTGLPCKGHTSGHLELGRCNRNGGRDGAHPLVRLGGSPMGLLALRDSEAIDTVARVAETHFAAAFMVMVRVPSHPGEYQFCLGKLDTQIRLLVGGPRQPTRPEVWIEDGETAAALDDSSKLNIKGSSPENAEKSKQQHIGTSMVHKTSEDEDWSDEERAYLTKVLGTGALCGAVAALFLIWCCCKPKKDDHVLVAPAPSYPSKLMLEEGCKSVEIIGQPLPQPLGRSKSAPVISMAKDNGDTVLARWEMKTLSTGLWKPLDVFVSSRDTERLYNEWQAGRTGPFHEVCGVKGACGLDFRTMTLTNLESKSVRALRRRYVDGLEPGRYPTHFYGLPVHQQRRTRRQKSTSWAFFPRTAASLQGLWKGVATEVNKRDTGASATNRQH